jgi:hypothetical protein
MMVSALRMMGEGIVSPEPVRCSSCGILWRSQISQELIVRDQRCPACREPFVVTAPEVRRLHSGAEGAVEVLDEAPARLEEVGFPDEAALLDRTFEALRRESRMARARAREQREQARRTRARLAGQRRALRWTLRQLARRESLDGRQRQLLAELNEAVRRAESLLDTAPL